ncbi:MAG: DUF1501 domain-containing protein [Pirellulaceae bacterium]|nr:DUF1501 domain-containing protein [Pirellulaceae bacterium]
MMFDQFELPQITRRSLLRFGIGSAVGLPLNSALQRAFAHSQTKGGKARSVILLFTWGGMSHLDTWDMKPKASSDIRGEFNSISTSVNGLRICEHLPLMSQQMHHLALVRSVHHQATDHRKAAYWSLTGHPPTVFGVEPVQLPSRNDWPCIGSQVAKALDRDYSNNPSSSAASIVDDAIDQDGELTVPTPHEDSPPLKAPIIQSTSLSTDVLGPGRYSTGNFDRQDGYTNNDTVELIGKISLASQDRCPLTRQLDGPVADFSPYLAGDSTAGDWGSDTHGRGGNLFLPGAGESNVPQPGFGAHANKFITFDLTAVRRKQFANQTGHWKLTGFVGVNGAPSVPAHAAIQAGVWIDGKPVDVSEQRAQMELPHGIDLFIESDRRWLTLAMLNGPDSTLYDDVALRDLKLSLIEGDLPPEAFERKVKQPPAEPELEPRAVNDKIAAALPKTISMPYPVSDRGVLNGQFGGFLGDTFDPVFIRPKRGRPFKGLSRQTGHVDLGPVGGIGRSRFRARIKLLENLEGTYFSPSDFANTSHKRTQAINMLMSPTVQEAFDLRREPHKLREAYGNHVCGQSVLQARRLAEAGVPLITVYCSSGDLNSGQGDHWDTHGNNFVRLKSDLLPPIDRAASALLADLHERGRLDDIMVVMLGEFGRTPKINGSAGRDHFPGCYSMWFAGGGIQGGQVYGSSDANGIEPLDDPCTPEDLHATIFHALGIDPTFTIHDLEDRPLPLSDGTALPLFG